MQGEWQVITQNYLLLELLQCIGGRMEHSFTWYSDPASHNGLLVMTQRQAEVRILSGRTQKLKVAKRCCKQLNEHNLMYIYHKQCENMQKKQ